MKSERTVQIMLALAAVGSVIATGACVLGCAWILLAAAGRLVTPPAFAQTSRPAVELERAINQEQVDGNLNAAIAAYQKIAADAAAPREVRAKALLQLAGCYEKLGRQAGDVYQQIVRDYGDQPAAAQARTRLAAMKKEAGGGATARKIDLAGRNLSPWHTDGEHVVYSNAATGELIYGDLAGKTKRVIYKAAPGDLTDYYPSRDFSMVAMFFADKPGRPGYIALIKNDGTGYRELVRNDEQGQSQGLGLDLVGRITWSWDKRDLLFSGANRTSAPVYRGGRVLAVSVSDGKRRKIVEVEPWAARGAMFSPDGRFVAYETIDNVNPFRTYVVPAAGGKPSLIHEELNPELSGGMYYPSFHDWTADGRYLAITSSSGGAPALQLFPVEDGQAAGPPILVRPGRFFIGSTTPAGALVSWLAEPPGITIRLAPLDPEGKVGAWQRLDLRGRSLGGASEIVVFSPDSNEIVYTARNDDPGQPGATIARVRNLTTGQDRELYRSTTLAACFLWPEPARVLCGEASSGPGDLSAGKVKAFSISLESGAISPLGEAPIPVAYIAFEPSRDGRSAYLARARDASGTIDLVRMEAATGQETVVERNVSNTSFFRLSPDERWLVRGSDWKLEVRPTSGGDWKLLASVNKANKAVAQWGGVLRELAVAPDGRWVIYHDVDAGGKQALFRVPISGGAPERLGEYFSPTPQFGYFGISPDGRKIVATSLGEERREMWLVQNLVPAAPKR